MLGCDRTSLSRWIKEEGLEQELIDARDIRLDMLEEKLMENALGDKEASLIFALKTQGRSRGYSEKVDVEHTGKDGEPLTLRIEIIKPDVDKIE